MRQLAADELQVIAGGCNYTPPENPDTEPLRAGIADLGGYANHFCKEYLSFDITGDNLAYNKALGGTLFCSFIVLGVTLGVSVFPRQVVN